LTKALVGRWVAADPKNPTLHHRDDGVAREEVDIHADGTLVYHLQAKSTSQPSKEVATSATWGWKVAKGRLLLKDIGEGSTQEWMRPLKIGVSDTSLTIERRKYPTKEFTRTGTADRSASQPAAARVY
jgi:hypothetical protein